VTEEVKAWFRETFAWLHEYQFGVYDASTDLVNQVKTWHCFGCSAEAFTEWPTWGKPNFVHSPNCVYVKFAREMGIEDHSLPILCPKESEATDSKEVAD
jgi:hypothetical protein